MSNSAGDKQRFWFASFLNSGKIIERPDSNRNPRLLTQFPTPGDVKRRTVVPLACDGLPDVAPADNGDISASSGQNSEMSRSPVLGTDQSLSALALSREYWMPDKLCKTCYECELPFNMFRRKHHCRFCGQVFCHSCSSYFVDGRLFLIVGMVRACKLCHGQIMTNNHPLSSVAPVAQHTDGSRRLQSPVHAFSFPARRPFSASGTVDGKRAVGDIVNRDATINHTQSSQTAATQKSSADNSEPVGFRYCATSSLFTSALRSLNTSTSQEPGTEPAVSAMSRISSTAVGLKDYAENRAPAVRYNRGVSSGTDEHSHFDTPGDTHGAKTPGSPCEDRYGSSAPMYPSARNINSADHGVDFRQLRLHAALRLEYMVHDLIKNEWTLRTEDTQRWCRVILSLCRQACSRINPNVRENGDNMDVRPYANIKTIPGGSHLECCCVNGVVFRKDVVHKLMQKATFNPRILLIAGGIEFQRSHSKLSSFSTLTEQEQKYTQIIVEKIVRVRPQLLLVGQAISRQAQEHLRQHNIIALQHVKPKLMQRIARQTRATILTSTDHVTNMGQYIGTALGTCQNFQMVAFPSALIEDCASIDHKGSVTKHTVPQIKRERGRGYVRYVYLTGCSASLGCSLVLRGAPKAILKKIKAIVRFTMYLAYHLRLECAFLNDCFARVSSCDRQATFEKPLLSASLAVTFEIDRNRHGFLNRTCGCDYCQPPHTTAHDHQSILLTTLWMCQRNQQVPAEVRGIIYYTKHDICLGEFLLDSCFDLQFKIQQSEKRTVLDMTQIFYHHDGCIEISVCKTGKHQTASSGSSQNVDTVCAKMHPIFAWSFCTRCNRIVTPMVQVSDDTWKMSFGKFLEICFYNTTATSQSGTCSHALQTDHVRFFRWQNLVARFGYSRIQPLDVYVRQRLPFDRAFYHREVLCRCSELRAVSKSLHVSFDVKINKLQAAFSAVIDSSCRQQNQMAFQLERLGTGEDGMQLRKLHLLFGSIRYEINHLGLEIQQHMLQLRAHLGDELERPAWAPSESTGTAVNYPSQIRRELYLRSKNWNCRLLLMGRLAASLSVSLAQWNGEDKSLDHSNEISAIAHNGRAILDEVVRLKEVTSSRLLSSLEEYCDEAATEEDCVDELTDETEKAVVGHSYGRHMDLNDVPVQQVDCSRHSRCPVVLLASSQRKLPAHAPQSERTAFSRREFGRVNRMSDHLSEGSVKSAVDDAIDVCSMSDRPAELCDDGNTVGESCMIDRSCSTPPRDCLDKSPGVHKRFRQSSTPYTRVLGKDNLDADPWMVDLKELEEEHCRLDEFAIANGDILLVHEEQPTTIIAYSLNTTFYRRTLQSYVQAVESCGQDCASHLVESFDNANVADNSASVLETGSHTDEQKTHSRCTRQCDSMLVWSRRGLSAVVDSPPFTADAASPTAFINLRNGLAQKRCVADANALYSMDADSNDLTKTGTYFDDPRSNLLCGFRKGFVRTVTPARKHAVTALSVSPVVTRHQLHMLSPLKTHVKHRFADVDDKGNVLCKFVCHAYWTVQFSAVRQAFFGDDADEETGFLRSLSMARPWNAQGGKSGATFLKTTDGRFVVKHITRTELQMFLEYAPAYFEYQTKSIFENFATILVKIIGVYQIGSHNRVSGKRIMEQVVIMQNLFHECVIARVFDLKGSTRSRYARVPSNTEHRTEMRPRDVPEPSDAHAEPVLLDENFVEFSEGRPLPLHDQARAYFNNAVINDTLFLSLINVVDYSMLVGMDDKNCQLVVGIIDYMRQYDIIKKVERMGKSVGMIAGQAEPTVIQPPNYRNRFQVAMDKYFMMVPDKWTPFRMSRHNA